MYGLVQQNTHLKGTRQILFRLIINKNLLFHPLRQVFNIFYNLVKLEFTHLVQPAEWSAPREGIINEYTLNDLFHHRRDVIRMSRMAIINIYLTV